MITSIGPNISIKMYEINATDFCYEKLTLKTFI